MTSVFVSAKYNEDISWSVDLNRVIYDKSDNPVQDSIPLKNIGRESDSCIKLPWSAFRFIF